MMTGSERALVDAASLTAHGEWSAADDARPYDIRYCTQRRYLQMRFFGEWNVETFDRFAADYRAAIGELARHGGVTHLLSDGSAYGVQPPEVADRFAELIRETAPSPAQRTACVVPALVNRVQARTGGDLINARYFRSVDDAADWLFSDEA